ncbi:MAG: DUF2079 domain-containing protein, partial [Nanoarchaeota archaeon]|nr:DUF2079 domain-containing protein [Nanoarchaeota archaeon]
MIIVEFVKKIIKNEKSYLLAPLIFFIITISFSFVLYNNVHYIYEIGFIEQAEWNTLNGNFFSSVSNGGNHFARHNSPILFIFLPIYYLFENITIFIILTNLLIAISAVPIYLFAKEYLKSKKAGIVFMISYLLFPSFYYSNLRSFHPIMLSVSFLAFALYFLYKKNVKFFLISIILAMLTNETVSFIVFMIGIYTLIKYDKKLGLILMIIGITWFQLSTTVIMPHFSTETKYPFIKELYGHLGTDFKEIITTIITKPGYALSYGSLEGKIIYFRSLFQHTFFISLLAPEVLIIGIPVIIQNIFSASGYKYDILAHYSYPLIPLIMYATIIGIKRIRKLFKKNILNNILI